MFLPEKLQRLRDELGMFEDAHERLAAVVDRARRVAPLRPTERSEANRVRGCVSVVWLVAEARDGRCFFRGDAESPVVRALVVLLCEFFHDVPGAEIAASAVEPLDELDLTRNLSPTRRHGLAAVRRAIGEFARASVVKA